LILSPSRAPKCTVQCSAQLIPHSEFHAPRQTRQLDEKHTTKEAYHQAQSLCYRRPHSETGEPHHCPASSTTKTAFSRHSPTSHSIWRGVSPTAELVSTILPTLTFSITSKTPSLPFGPSGRLMVLNWTLRTYFSQ
jgi:hypothetical protein